MTNFLFIVFKSFKFYLILQTMSRLRLTDFQTCFILNQQVYLRQSRYCVSKHLHKGYTKYETWQDCEHTRNAWNKTKDCWQ